MLSSKNNLISVVIQVLIWLSFGSALLLSQPFSWGIEVPAIFWVKQVATILLLVVAYYINSRLLAPQLLLKHRMRDFLICITILVVIVVTINSLLDKCMHIPELMDAAFRKHGPPRKHEEHHFRLDMFTLVTTALIMGVSTSVTSVQKLQNDNRLHQELKQQRTDSELSFLKAQINPHFFFNTLNNIYMLTMIDVETSRQALHKLSRMMRYVLYETQNDTTLLSKEVDFIKDYIELMRLRLTDKVTLTFEEPAHLQDRHIAPMMFLPFVENAFKHGVSATHPSEITIRIKQHDAALSLNVSNTIVTEDEKTLDGNSGIGLANTRRRLDLLYPGRYELKIEQPDKGVRRYIVHLTLQLI